uniref:Uncharacterized protein n=1 Tax=Bosea sp. NBC_00436 TaxID=2969620 RepID=A0A9E8A280_9HYPH
MLAFGSQARSAEPILKQMHGTWRSENRLILIDTERMLGNTDDTRPFQRDALTLRNISGRMIVFEIGRKRFIGLFDRNELRLTGDGIADSEILHRR